MEPLQLMSLCPGLIHALQSSQSAIQPFSFMTPVGAGTNSPYRRLPEQVKENPDAGNRVLAESAGSADRSLLRRTVTALERRSPPTGGSSDTPPVIRVDTCALEFGVHTP